MCIHEFQYFLYSEINTSNKFIPSNTVNAMVKPNKYFLNIYIDILLILSSCS